MGIGLKRISARFTSPAANAVRGRSSSPAGPTSCIRQPTTATSRPGVQHGELPLEPLGQRPVVGVLHGDDGRARLGDPPVEAREMPM